MTKQKALELLQWGVEELQKEDSSEMLILESFKYFKERLKNPNLPHPWECQDRHADGTVGFMSFGDIIDDLLNTKILLEEQLDAICDCFPGLYNDYN